MKMLVNYQLAKEVSVTLDRIETGEAFCDGLGIWIKTTHRTDKAIDGVIYLMIGCVKLSSGQFEIKRAAELVKPINALVSHEPI